MSAKSVNFLGNTRVCVCAHIKASKLAWSKTLRLSHNRDIIVPYATVKKISLLC